MGMYDTIWFKCPKCGSPVEVQSKAAACIMASFRSKRVPLRIAGDIQGRVVTCDGQRREPLEKKPFCGASWRVRTLDEIEAVAMQLVPPDEEEEDDE